MKIRFWGARGGFAATGPSVLRYGGNTCSVELRNDAGERLLIDLGSGAINCGRALMADEFSKGQGQLAVLISHTHLDHVQGLPFFVPFFIPGNKIDLYGAPQHGQSLRQTLQDLLNHHYSPLNSLDNLFANVQVCDLPLDQTLSIAGFAVRAIELPHGQTTSLGFRIEADGKSVSIFSDVEHDDGVPPREVVDFIRGSDVLIHDAMYGDGSDERFYARGHSSAKHAVDVAELANTGLCILYHHAPTASDDSIDKMLVEAQKLTRIPLLAGVEGQSLVV